MELEDSAKRLWKTTDAEQTSANSKGSYYLRNVKPWLLDLVSLICAAALVVAVLVLFMRYDDQPVPDWQFVTFNFVVSVLAKAISAAIGVPLADCLGQLKWHAFWKQSRPRPVMHFQSYSDASAGAWGAFLMLCKPKLWHFSSIGALLVLAVLAIDPFLQQMPTFPIKLVTKEGSESASVNVANQYAALTLDLQGQQEGGAYGQLASEPKGAFYTGIYGSPQGIQPNCRTGNCTWDHYSTLGFCSACADISSLLKDKINYQGFDGPSYDWRLPNGMTIEDSSTVMAVSTQYPTIKFSHLKDYSIVDMTSIYYASTTQTSIDTTPPYASECVLYFCIQDYNSSSRGGVFKEDLLSIFPDSSTPIAVAQAALSVPPSVKGAESNASNLHPTGYVTNDASSAVNFTLTHPETQTEYHLDADTIILMREWLQVALTALMSRVVVAGGDTLDSSTTASDIAELLYDAQMADNGPTAIMHNVSTSLSALVRNSGGQTATGVTQVPRTYIHVRWIWFSLPVGVLVLTIIFLAGTITMSTMRQVPIWRCSALPSLLYPLDRETAATISASGPVLSKMEKAAERFGMAMDLDDDWRLQGVRSTSASDSTTISGRRRK